MVLTDVNLCSLIQIEMMWMTYIEMMNINDAI